MFTYRAARFRLAEVLTLVHVILACVLLPLAHSDDHSVILAAHRRSARRVPTLSFRVIEGSNHGELPVGVHAVPHRRSHHRPLNKDENYVLRRVPVSAHRQAHYRRANVNDSHNRNRNHNVNVNVMRGSGAVYEDIQPFNEIDYNEKQTDVDSIVIKLESKLYSVVTFRANIIAVFGQILKAPNNVLTVDQYTSLNLILQALIHKQVYMFNILPVLKKMQTADKKTQFELVMQALTNNVPVYMACACKFWINEIHKLNVDIDQLTASIEQPADFLTGLDPEVIDTCKVKVAAEELEPFDEPSKLTKTTLGSVFVNIFNKIKNHQITLSPKLFAAILINLPIGKINPMLEEYINYIWDTAQQNMPANWYDIAPEIEYGNPYEVVHSVIKKLMSKEDTPEVLKHALKYILLHLKAVPTTFSDEYHTDMQILLNNDKNVPLLFSMIQNDLAIPEMGDLRDRLITFIEHINIDDILQGMNKYMYQKPIDLLIALLTRIQGRTQEKEIKDTVAKLLSILISKTELGTFTLTVSADIDLMTLLDFLNVPDNNPAISALGQEIQSYLGGDLDLLSKLQELIPKEDKSKCYRPIQCLLYVCSKMVEPNTAEQLGIPSSLILMIHELLILMKNMINNSAKCEPHDVISVEGPELPNDLLNVVLPPVPDTPGSMNQTELPQSPIPIENPTYWPMPPKISTDFKETIYKPDYSDLPSGEVVEIVYPKYPDDEVEDSSYRERPDDDLLFPNDWVLKPKLIELPKPKPTLIPKSRPKPIPTVKPSSVTQVTRASESPVIEQLNPMVIQPVKPQVKPSSSPTTLPAKKPTVFTTAGLVPTTKATAKHPPNNSSPQAENEPVLPPNLSYDRPMYVVFPKGDAPPYTLPTKPTGTPDSESVVEFPSIKDLLQGFEPNTPFHPDELPDMPDILEPLKQTLGPNFVEELLGKQVNKAEYPTVISLMDDVLDHALENPKVMANDKLVLSITRYLKGIDYISATALFPVVVDSQKITSDLLYVTFDSDNPNANSVDSEPPSKISAGFMTLPIYHPKYWVQQVDPANPYGTLLPSTEESENNPIQDLINDGSLQEILGPEFDPLLYPNKGTLLTTVLQKLIISQRVKSDPPLMKKLNAYLKSIRAVALYSHIPDDYDTHFLQLQQNNDVNWQPDTVSLITALPPARNKHELKKIGLIKSFLETPNLLELLQIEHPPYSTTRGALLKMIFKAAIHGKKIVLDPKTLAALKFYQSKILMKGYGALPIVWVWVQMFIIREEVPLGQIIESVIDYNSLPHEMRMSYNDVMTYLSDNQQLLQGNDDFAFEKYPTKGTFLRGLFTHFLTKPDVSPKAKKDMKQIVPYIKLSGHGAEPMNHVTIDDITNSDMESNRFSVLLSG